MQHFYEGKTLHGLGWVRWSMWIFIAFILANLALSVAIAVFLLPALLGAPFDLLTAALSMLAAVCGLLLLGLAGLILYLIGFSQMYGGRYEYGARHAQYMVWAFVLLVFTVALSLASSGAPYGSVITVTPSSPTATLLSVAAAGVLRTATTAVAGLTLLFSLYGLAEPGQARRLTVALILGVIAAAAGSAITIMGLTSQPPSGYDIVIIAASLAGSGVGAISMLLFALVYREVDGRLRSGAIPPALAVRPPWPYYYPMYPYTWTAPPGTPPPSPPSEKPPSAP